LTINRQLPGPPIQVCFRDIVVVDVENHMDGTSTSIHWHGLRQFGSPFSDGVRLSSLPRRNETHVDSSGSFCHSMSDPFRQHLPLYFRGKRSWDKFLSRSFRSSESERNLRRFDYSHTRRFRCLRSRFVRILLNYQRLVHLSRTAISIRSLSMNFFVGCTTTASSSFPVCPAAYRSTKAF
jgi:Multicopper oxidase